MKKTQNKQYKFFIKSVFVLCLIFFNVSCGLDIIEYYEPPYLSKPAENESEVTEDPSQRYLEFYTNNSENTISSFKGTSVYYRIYNSKDKAESDRKTLIALSENSYGNNAAERMINDSKYKALNFSGNTSSDVLINKSSDNQKIKLDFTDANGKYCIYVDNESLSSREMVRWGTSYNFDFPNYAEKFNREVYESQDEDVDFNGDSGEGEWYIQFFAVSVGLSATYTQQFSNIVYLGCIRF